MHIVGFTTFSPVSGATALALNLSEHIGDSPPRIAPLRGQFVSGRFGLLDEQHGHPHRAVLGG
jgi:hypothetical protein